MGVPAGAYIRCRLPARRRPPGSSCVSLKSHDLRRSPILAVHVRVPVIAAYLRPRSTPLIIQTNCLGHFFPERRTDISGPHNVRVSMPLACDVSHTTERSWVHYLVVITDLTLPSEGLKERR